MVKICLLFLLVFAVGSFVIRKIKSGQKRKEREQIFRAIHREQNLDELILNAAAKDLTRQENRAYEVNYADKKIESRSAVWIEIEERTKLSSKKYMLDLTKSVRIGTDTYGNAIVIKGCGKQKYLCEIQMQDKQICIYNRGKGKIQVIRKKERAYLGLQGLILNSGDIIRIEHTDYIISHIEIRR